MNSTAKTGITIDAFLIVVLVWFVGSYFSYANTAVDYETHIEYAVESVDDQKSQFRLSVVEAVQTIGFGADLNTNGAVAQIAARYGEGGSQAMMQWLTENNIAAVSQEALEGVRRQIDAGRQSLSQANKRLFDICRGYDTVKRRPYSGFWVRLAGYPSDTYKDKGGNEKLCTAILSNGAKKARETGIEDALDIRSGEPEA